MAERDTAGLPPARLRHYREPLDVRGDPNTFVADQAANAHARLRELYAGTCHGGTFIEDVVAVDPDTAQQPCEYQYDSPEGLAQVCVGFTARIREFAQGDIVSGVTVGDSNAAYVFGERPGRIRVAVQGADAGVLRKGQRVPVKILIAQYPHGSLPVAVVELVSARTFAGAAYRLGGRPDPARVAGLQAAAEHARTTRADLETLEGPAAKRAVQFQAAVAKATGAPKKNTLDLAALDFSAELPSGTFRCVAGRIAKVDAPEAIELPAAAAVAELLAQQAAFDGAARAIGLDYANDADFAAHSNVWRLFERPV